MVAFNFASEFAGPVERRVKRTTIRQTRRAKVGDRIQLYTGQRTAECRKLTEDDPVCTRVTYVAIRESGITLGNVEGLPRNRDEFARMDGFEDYAAMLSWFQQRYGKGEFVGYFHQWEFEAPSAA